MKTIGLLGGMSWESTVSYYRLINQRVGERLGALHSAEIVLYSVDFEPIEQLQHAGAWGETADILLRAARSVEGAGADFLLICTNTMHMVYDEIANGVGIPVLHIADATAKATTTAGLKSVGLLGTRFTMEEEFYRGRLESWPESRANSAGFGQSSGKDGLGQEAEPKDRVPGALEERHGLEILVPGAEDREIVHRVIYDQLCRGSVCDTSRREYARIISGLVERGAEGVILGCTEIGLLVGPDDAAVPVFDTAEIHAHAAADLAIDDGPGPSPEPAA